MFVVNVVCCQVEVSATSWSLVQRSSTDRGASFVWSRNLKNEEAMTRVGSQRHKKKSRKSSDLPPWRKIEVLYSLLFINNSVIWQPIPVAARSKAWACGRSHAESVGLSRAAGINISLFSVLCLLKQISLRRADHSSRGVLPTVVRRYVWSRNIKNKETMNRVGQQQHGKRKSTFQVHNLRFQQSHWKPHIINILTWEPSKLSSIPDRVRSSFASPPVPGRRWDYYSPLYSA